MAKTDIIIKDTHRALLYQDGVLVRVLEAGRYDPPRLQVVRTSDPETVAGGQRLR